ncbi:MAG: SDR family NAD(P)-dependent oxidoreductase [Lentisphaerae bacterium]|nr:SDR family NAD(P)-dependent oxidoreductase [Lentisphaerota bacterium]
MSFPSVNRSVLVTGCSSGIGLATAALMKARGWQVFATARQAADLDTLRAAGFTAIELDLAHSDSVQQAARLVLDATGGTLGALVNNAGMGVPGAMEDLDRNALRHQFEVNVFGLHELTRAVLPGFRRQGAGRIVNVSSVLGRMTLPFMGAYCASKHAVESLSDALRVELIETGIAVSLVEPGPIITAFRLNAIQNAEHHIDMEVSRFGPLFVRELERRRHAVKQPGLINKPPEAVAARIRHALESPRPRRRYCVTIPAHAGAWMRRLMPDACMDALLTRRVRRQRAALQAPSPP